MEYESMVHALEEVHRLLKPAGRLIDIHPVLEAPFIEVHLEGRVLFAEANPDHTGGKTRHADDALAQVFQRRLFVVERSGEFDFLTYGSSVTELRAFVAKAGAYNDSPKDEAVVAREAELHPRVEAIMQAAGEEAEVATHERGRIARLRPTTP